MYSPERLRGPAQPMDRQSAQTDQPLGQPLAAIAAGAAWLVSAEVTIGWPDLTEWERAHELAVIKVVIGLVILLGVLTERHFRPAHRIRHAGPWLIAIAVFVTTWEIATAKTGHLPLPFFPPPQSILEVYTDDWGRLGDSLLHSIWLLTPGFFIGSTVGFVLGVAIGWSRAVGYWGHPFLRVVGPLPASAWLPLAFFFFPSSWSAGTFVIALAAFFPVAVLTSSGIAGVSNAYYDIARTLGASQRFMIFKIAIPAAMPHVFVGLFMGLGASFAILVVAEMMGVKSGLGFYLHWAQGWAAYSNMYAGLVVMTLTFSGITALLFKLRNRLLSWQKDLVRW